MDNEIKLMFKIIGLEINHFDELNEMLIARETLLSDNKYDKLKISKIKIICFKYFLYCSIIIIIIIIIDFMQKIYFLIE